MLGPEDTFFTSQGGSQVLPSGQGCRQDTACLALSPGSWRVSAGLDSAKRGLRPATLSLEPVMRSSGQHVRVHPRGRGGAVRMPQERHPGQAARRRGPRRGPRALTLSPPFLPLWSSFPLPSHQFPEPTPALPEILVSFS